LARVNGPWLKQELGISILIKIGPTASVLSWQQQNRYHSLSFVMNISGAKFEEQCF